MNIGNHGYSSWIHHTPQTGYVNGSRTVQTGKAGAGKTGFGGNKVNDTSVINGAAVEKTEEKEKSDKKNTEDLTYREQILAHMEEMAKKVKEGRVEPSFQIGGQSFTIKEWEKLLANFDDAEEGLQEQIREMIAEVEKQAAREAARREAEGRPDSAGTKEAKGDNVTDVMVTDPEEIAALLTNEVTKCSYPAEDPKNKHWYITCYGQDGIMCREAYMENGKWVNRDCWNLPYTEPGQREKVLAFIQRFPQDANLRFTSHENFWKDFLAGEIDENDFVTHFYTAEEMGLIQRAIINENRKGLQKISDYDGQMTIPADVKNGEGEGEEDDIKTQIITKPDGSVVLQIETNFGVMEVEVTEAQKFGLQYNARPGFDPEQVRSANPFARGAGVAAAYGAED